MTNKKINDMTFKPLLIMFIAIMVSTVLFPIIANSIEINTDYKKMIGDTTKKLEMTWSFGGSEMPPAEMYFWSNGLLILDSKMFSKTKTKFFFTWALSDDKSRLDLKFIDERINFKDFLAVEKTHPKHIIAFDENNKTISYRVINKQSFFFGNWLFEKME